LTNIDATLKAKTYRQLGWLYFYSDQLNKATLLLNSQTNQADSANSNTNIVAPIRGELKGKLISLVTADFQCELGKVDRLKSI